MSPARRVVCTACNGSPDGSPAGACAACDARDRRRQAAARRRQAAAGVRCAQQRDAIAALLARVEPDLAPARIVEAVGQAAPSCAEIATLSRHLAVDVGMLVSGAAAVPAVVNRLTVGLAAAGARQVTPARCAGCGRAVLLRHPGDHGRICQRCYEQTRRPLRHCAGCGLPSRRRASTPDGAPLCSRCRWRDPAGLEPCAGCGQRRPVNARTEHGAPRCSSCYQPPKVACDGCGRLAPVAARRQGRPVCATCYQRQLRPRRRCGQCGRTRRIRQRATDTTPDLCYTCLQWPTAVCQRCGRHDRCQGVRRGRPTCLRCLLDDQLTALLGGPASRLPPALARLQAAILDGPNPQSALGWLARSPAVGVLVELAHGRLPLTHQALDGVPPSPAVDHLRELLVAAGALPERNPHLARLEQVVGVLVASLDPDSARLFRAFASWRVVARLRRRFDQAKGTVLAVDNAQQTLRETARFLTWLHQQGRSMADCRQADIDGWVTSGASTRRWIRDFLVWAAERRLTTVQPPLSPPRGAPVTADDVARWAQARRLLHDATLDPADRAAGLLVLLYGQPVSRIARLTVDNIIDTPQGASLRLGRDSIQLPQPLGDLLRGLGDRQHVGVAGRLTGPSGWLFPGRRAGQHLSPAQLQRRLGTLGIAARANRNAALLQLAGEVPIAVLADLLNLHLSTAQRWAEQAGANWARYAASRRSPVRPPRPAITATSGPPLASNPSP